MATEIVELRCPTGPRALLTKIRQAGEKPQYVEGNLLELYCRDCTRNARQFDPNVQRVLHLFNFAGELVRSAVDKK